VNPERAAFRVARADGTPARRGEAGRLILTVLSNYVQPFVNYDIGDRAAMGDDCPCGRGWPTLEAIEGRTTEALVTGDGRRVSGPVLGMFLNAVCGIVPFVWEYQAVQGSDGAVELRIVPTGRFTREIGGVLAGRRAALLGPDVAVRVTTVEALERTPSGKRLVIRSAVAGGERAPTARSARDR
jgi:phenylacetate-CoA ligase